MTRNPAAFVPCLLLSLLLFSFPLPAQQARVEPIGTMPSANAPAEIVQAVEDKGYRVTLDDGWTASLWAVKELKSSPRDASEALYPTIPNGKLVGVITLPKGMSDFRGQAVPAGTYTLRYQSIPQDANHMGVSPNPDFLLAIPASSDSAPDTDYPYRKMVSLSSRTTGAHPAVIALDSAGEPGKLATHDKMVVLTVPVKTTSGNPPLAIGVVLKGQAAQ
jgi:hypothetical protein